MNRTFSLARFIPLLSERMYVISPFTRNYLVSWITVLDSVPSLELVSFLPSFLDGLFKYLSDPNTDVRIATSNVLADFLREIREAEEEREKNGVQRAEREERRERREERRKERELKRFEKESSKSQAKEKKREQRGRKGTNPSDLESTEDDEISTREPSPSTSKIPRSTSPTKQSLSARPSTADTIDGGSARSESGSVIDRETEDQQGTDEQKGEEDDEIEAEDGEEGYHQEQEDGDEEREDSVWVPGQEVRIDHAAIIEILIRHILYPGGSPNEVGKELKLRSLTDHFLLRPFLFAEEEVQATTLQWIAEFLLVVKSVVVPFTPRLIPAILPSLAHHRPTIASAASSTNINLYRVIQQLPAPATVPSQNVATASTAPSVKDKDKDKIARIPSPSVSQQQQQRRGLVRSPPLSPQLAGLDGIPDLSPSSEPTALPAADPFNYSETVNVLTLQLLDAHAETRVSSLEWLLMLHRKAPRKILAMNDGTFPALLKTLSDPSDDVVRCDLRLLAQISSASEDAYFHSFMADLLSLFSTDRRLLETRGSLIIRQLCVSLNTDRIFRTLAEILEKDEDLEFASIMVQTLNIILLTSPELSEFRRRLKNLDGSGTLGGGGNGAVNSAAAAREGAQLFVILYRSWSHNAVATLSLCLLAQAYEAASSLLHIFADLEITVSLLIQVDKLVQLLESPIFTFLRLQLLEPEKNPFLFKTLYGLLMLLPQSSAFSVLRNRLGAVSSMGFLHTNPRGSTSSSTGSGASSATGGNTSSTRSKFASAAREEVRWNELLTHFRSVQARHEKARRLGSNQSGGVVDEDVTTNSSNQRGGTRTPSSAQQAAARRKASIGANSTNTASSSRNPSNVNAPSSFRPQARNAAGSGSSALDLSNPSQTSPSFFGLHIGQSGTGHSGSNTPIRPTSPATGGVGRRAGNQAQSNINRTASGRR